jgi:hypothetical protein
MDTPNDLTRLSVCGGSDSACVQDEDVSAIGSARFPPAGLQKLPFERRAVRLACPATEIMELKSGHRSNRLL